MTGRLSKPRRRGRRPSPAPLPIGPTVPTALDLQSRVTWRRSPRAGTRKPSQRRWAKLDRAYYRCNACNTGIRPRGRELGNLVFPRCHAHAGAYAKFRAHRLSSGVAEAGCNCRQPVETETVDRSGCGRRCSMLNGRFEGFFLGTADSATNLTYAPYKSSNSFPNIDFASFDCERSPIEIGIRRCYLNHTVRSGEPTRLVGLPAAYNRREGPPRG